MTPDKRCGPRPASEIPTEGGVIEAGVMADIVIFNKNFMEDVSIIEDAENNLKVIIKDGRVYKNTL